MKLMQVVASTALAWSLAAPAYAVEGDVSKVAQDHLAMAASYEEKATAQEALVAEHTQMKRDYKSRFYINEKVTPLRKVQKMEEHCDAIIKQAHTLATELREFAKWHRMRAAELEGR